MWAIPSNSTYVALLKYFYTQAYLAKYICIKRGAVCKYRIAGRDTRSYVSWLLLSWYGGIRQVLDNAQPIRGNAMMITIMVEYFHRQYFVSYYHINIVKITIVTINNIIIVHIFIMYIYIYIILKMILFFKNIVSS